MRFFFYWSFACAKVESLLHYDRLVLRNQSLHDAPSYEVSHTTDAEHNHVGTWLAIKAHEAEGRTLALGIGEEHTGTLVDKEGTDTTRHGKNKANYNATELNFDWLLSKQHEVGIQWEGLWLNGGRSEKQQQYYRYPNPAGEDTNREMKLSDADGEMKYFDDSFVCFLNCLWFRLPDDASHQDRHQGCANPEIIDIGKVVSLYAIYQISTYRTE